MFLLLYKLRYYLFTAILITSLTCVYEINAQDIHNPDTIMARVIEAISVITDYTSLFSKQELIEDRVICEDNIILKVKRPGQFYMKWTSGPNTGRIAIYEEGKNKNRLLLYSGGVMGFLPVLLDPNGKIALSENRHPITEADFTGIFDRFRENYNICRRDPECSVAVINLDDYVKIELRAKHSDGKGYYAHRGELTIEKKRWLPTGIICYGWQNEFLEEYRFSDIKINPGLTDRDFAKDR